MGDALLEVEALIAGYGEVQVLWGLSLAAPRGRLTTLVGANGAGKTTTLKALVGTLAPWGGRVVFQGEGRQLFSSMTVEENLEMGAFSRRGARRYADRLEWVFTLFPRLKERRRQNAGTFSGGEQQMLAIARGLMTEPEILIIDELSLGLAPVVVYQLFGTLKALKDAGLTILLVEQNVHLAFAVSDHAYVIAEGRVFTEGAPDTLAAMPEIRRAYLGL
jgi:branched-chain amino acid transport system ATP-binding protein